MTSQLELLTPARLRAPFTERFALWKATPEGARFLKECELRVLDLALNRPKRIEVNLVWASVRRDLKLSADNSFRAPFGKALLEKWEHLKPMIHLRSQKAA